MVYSTNNNKKSGIWSTYYKFIYKELLNCQCVLLCDIKSFWSSHDHENIGKLIGYDRFVSSHPKRLIDLRIISVWRSTWILDSILHSKKTQWPIFQVINQLGITAGSLLGTIVWDQLYRLEEVWKYCLNPVCLPCEEIIAIFSFRGVHSEKYIFIPFMDQTCALMASFEK